MSSSLFYQMNSGPVALGTGVFVSHTQNHMRLQCASVSKGCEHVLVKISMFSTYITLKINISRDGTMYNIVPLSFRGAKCDVLEMGKVVNGCHGFFR